MPRHVGSSRPTDGSSAEICSSAAAVIRFSQADDPHRTGSYGRSRTTSLPRTAIRRRCSSPSGWARWRWPATRTGSRHGRLSRGGSSSWNLRALPQALPSCILAAWLTRTPTGSWGAAGNNLGRPACVAGICGNGPHRYLHRQRAQQVIDAHGFRRGRRDVSASDGLRRARLLADGHLSSWSGPTGGLCHHSRKPKRSATHIVAR